MPTIEFETTIAAPLARVWEFHQDVMGSLPAVSPPGDQVRIEHADLPPRTGSRVIVLAKGPLGPVKWVAKYVEFVPPHPVVFGEEARFVDEQESGPFKRWRHSHEFEAIDAKTTRLVDRISYQVAYGPLGWIADKIVVRPRLRAMFRYRHGVLRRMFESGSQR
jgi:ligand-binding SRPBCC domain-containing protein